MTTSETAADRAHCLLETGLYSDLVVEVNHGTEKHSIKVHRAVLTIASSVWASAMKWSEDSILPVTEFPYTTMNAIVYFAYTGRVTFENLTHCRSVLAAAHYYDMPELSFKCGKNIEAHFLKSKLDLETIIDLFNMAVLYDSEIIIINCLTYIQDNTKLVLDSEEFLDICADALMMILVKKKCLCSENYMIRSVLRWATNTMTKSNCEDLREFLIRYNFLSNFQLGRLHLDEMQGLCKDYPTVFSDESIVLPSRFEGLLNQNLDLQIIVKCPPMVICEEFYNEGPTVDLLIYSITIKELFISDCSRQYEERFSISIDNIVGHFEGIVDKRHGATVRFPSPVNLTLESKSILKVFITLDKCQLYYKNSFSRFGSCLFRQKPGLIKNIKLSN